MLRDFRLNALGGLTGIPMSELALGMVASRIPACHAPPHPFTLVSKIRSGLSLCPINVLCCHTSSLCEGAYKVAVSALRCGGTPRALAPLTPFPPVNVRSWAEARAPSSTSLHTSAPTRGHRLEDGTQGRTKLTRTPWNDPKPGRETQYAGTDRRARARAQHHDAQPHNRRSEAAAAPRRVRAAPMCPPGQMISAESAQFKSLYMPVCGPSVIDLNQSARE